MDANPNPNRRRATPVRPTYTLSIDPSTKDMGLALFAVTVRDDDAATGTVRLLRSEAVKCATTERPGDDDWIYRVDEMVRVVVSRCVAPYRVDRVLIELPDHYGSGRGEAARNSGGILKLMALVFSIRQALFDFGDGEISVLLIPVRKWKGTVPKDITQKRVRREWGWKGTDHNEADAVGIGDWYFRKNLGYVVDRTQG